MIDADDLAQRAAVFLTRCANPTHDDPCMPMLLCSSCVGDVAQIQTTVELLATLAAECFEEAAEVMTLRLDIPLPYQHLKKRAAEFWAIAEGK